MKNSWIDDARLRYFLFTLMCLGYVCNGINLSMVGPSIEDLAQIYSTSLENISYGFTIKAISNCLSSIAAGFTMTYFSRHLQFSMALALYGLTSFLLTSLPSLQAFWTAWAVYGAASAYIDIAINVWVLELFELHNMNLHVQVIHLSFAVGQIFGPLMVAPYLDQDHGQNSALRLNETVTAVLQQKAPAIRWPYRMAGLCFLVVALIVFICYLVKPYIAPGRKVFGPKKAQLPADVDPLSCDSSLAERTPSDSLAQSADCQMLPDQEAAGGGTMLAWPCWFRSGFIVLLLLVFCIEVCTEYNLMMYIPLYLTKSDLRVPKRVAAELASTFGLAYTIGRAASMLLAFTDRVSIALCIYLQVSAAFVACVLFRFVCPLDLQDPSGGFFWTRASVWLVGLGFSSAFPNMMVFLEQRINITDRLNCSMLALSTVLFSGCSVVLARVLESQANSFVDITGSIILLMLVCFALLHSTDLFRRRFRKADLQTRATG